MTNKDKETAGRREIVVVDRDGVVIDDINMKFDTIFRRGNSLPERALKELIFVSLNLLPMKRKRILEQYEGLDPEAEEYMKKAQGSGKSIRVKTANMKVDAEKERSMLESHGIHAEVEHAGMFNKLDNYNRDEIELVEDNQLASLMALIRTGGTEKSIKLIRKDYNSISGFLIKAFGRHGRLKYTNLEEPE
ncbi:MAG: hypothetical protein M1279_01420 [Candidatus Marsarchaeota archaeon]|nr:hypothetical protein [Candidatus Marsarchaeota archaeon]